MKQITPYVALALWKKKPVFIRSASTIPRIDLSEQEKHVLRMHTYKNKLRLIVFFGFASPEKGVELLFDIADPVSDHIVIAGEIDKGGDYYRDIMRRASLNHGRERPALRLSSIY